MLAVCVAVAAAALAGFMGTLASILYGGIAEPPNELPLIGEIWGTCTGLVAAAFWCRQMFRRVRRGTLRSLSATGLLLGTWAGVISTVLLHGGLLASAAALDAETPFDGWSGYMLLLAAGGILVGLVLAAILGLVSGMICGRIAGPFVGAQ